MNEGKVRAILRENRRNIEEESNNRRVRELEDHAGAGPSSRSEIVGQVEAASGQRARGESSLELEQRGGPIEMENIAWFVNNSPPVPALARRMRREVRETSIDQEIVLEPPNSISLNLAVAVIEDEFGSDAVVTVTQPKLDWSLFQVWNNLAFATCSVPYRVYFDTREEKYILKSSRIQQIIFGMQNVAAWTSTIARWRTFVAILNGPPNPLKYVKFTGLAVKILAQAFQFKAVTFGMDDILQLHTLARQSDAVIINNFKIEMGKKRTTLYLTMYSLYLFGYCSISILMSTYSEYQSWEWGVAEIIQYLACYTRQVYSWATENDCPDAFISLKDIPLKESLYGGLGLCTYISRTILREHATLMIMTSCATLLQMSWRLKNSTTNQENSADSSNNGTTTSRMSQSNPSSCYDFLEQSANLISSFIGPLVVTSLVDVACDLPLSLNDTFNAQSVMAVLPTAHILITFLAFLLGCVSSMQINEVQDGIVELENNDDRLQPNDMRRFILYLLRVFRKSVGIGYRSLFVLNFPFIFTYCSIVASLICFTYETEHEQQKTGNR